MIPPEMTGTSTIEMYKCYNGSQPQGKIQGAGRDMSRTILTGHLWAGYGVSGWEWQAMWSLATLQFRQRGRTPEKRLCKVNP